MTTFTYLKKGRMGQRPYHLLDDNGVTALCGRVRVGDEGASRVCHAPEPAEDGLICERCRQVAALRTVQRVAASSPFREERG